MKNKNTGMIATIAAVVLCGCPGLFMCLFGAFSTVVSFIPGADIDINGSSDPASAMTMGISFLCGSIILIAIPVAVWFFTMRKKTADAAVVEMPNNNDSFPPTV
ncbi:hypothetical protein MASR2M66_05190 [Chloroflexota bacterium]